MSLILAGTLATAGTVTKRLARSLAGVLTMAGDVAAALVGPVLYYLPGTRDIRRASAREPLAAVSHFRARAAGRDDLESKG